MVESRNAASLVDHDIVFIDYISDRAMVFNGTPGFRKGHASKPTDLRSSMNEFLGNLNITFRRDKETKRPSQNKLDSYLDRTKRKKENITTYQIKYSPILLKKYNL